ncbi:PREDICTED: uncharacterized protein C20orf96 homolog isoform X1 [Galeopterus variegatus]|uniref:Uncharacterized protein C20orf96 homolog isoform X1 n=1 Tax=Galeopterus variegatus TaxID=482537 RepID=A0ABM0RZ82_GALVR|nr:PREDICTED: uncharacterized protein C20orf96 homolog isoform X1 [Galeopterus variegatus]XP_008585921.1 PREDICTED: uncharacterized protein C20orf96 homolog isoform X1 [Galeopterus variegatus]XP_008585922.1 PREDICTED: uncharacterized protein C20orf96 homolog isoform X1 [Galeopterus variegatus]XP_008585923.1 PREDICTED: uncharacterized protein C20orf96 homolog isoform X1 [Galeopterus variegatus]
MAHDSQNLSRPSLSGTHSTVHKFQTLDYVPWQRSKQKTKLSTLPPVREAAGHSKSRMKTLTRVQPVLHSKPTMVVTSQLRDPRELRRREQMDPGRKEATMRLMRKMLRNRRNSLRELLNHENFLTGLNRELIRTIQDMEDSTALNVRAMLQQQDILTTVIDILEWSNKKRLQQLKCELQEWEEKEKLKMSFLEQQVEQLNARIQKTHEEVNFLSTYMDHEYPVKSVQIASLMRQLQQVKDSQQDELDDLSEMRRMVLECMSKKIEQQQKKVLRSLVVKTQQPHQEALVQKTRESQDLLKCIHRFRDVHPRHGHHPQHPCGRAATLLDGRAVGRPSLPGLFPAPAAWSHLLLRQCLHSDPDAQFFHPSLPPV